MNQPCSKMLINAHSHTGQYCISKIGTNMYQTLVNVSKINLAKPYLTVSTTIYTTFGLKRLQLYTSACVSYELPPTSSCIRGHIHGAAD